MLDTLLTKIKPIVASRKMIAVAALLFPLLVMLLWPLPDPLFQSPYATTIETTEGELLGAMIASDGQWRFPVMDSVPSRFETALLHFEDEYFYQHWGINPISMAKALKANWQAGKIKRGGSTISMQVIRMARGNQPRTVVNKLIETMLSVKLELLYSKQEILSIYASHAPFGGNVVGLSAAAWRYYGRAAATLSWAECAALAVLPNSPALIFPGRNEIIFKNKRNKLLLKLYDKKQIDTLTYQLALEEPISQKPHDLPRLATHLLTRTIKEGGKGKRNVVTLDQFLQSSVTRIAQQYMSNLFGNQIHNAAVLVVEINSGETKAYIGNVRSEAIHGQEVDVVMARRSTGSLLKPFLYAAAIDEGLISPQQLLKDYPIFYNGFTPKNFDLKYRGAVQADEALTRSLNIPFVLLLKEYGYERFHQKLRRLGMTSLDQPAGHYGLSMILGGAEASLWELTNMYGNIFRVYQNSFGESMMNRYSPINYFHHQYLADQPIEKLRTGVQPDELSIASVWATMEALKGLHRPAAFSGWEQFSSAQQVAWKTGTSFGFRDAWAIGINGQYVVGVWVGNADGEGRPGLVGGSAAAPLMFQVFEQIQGTAFDQVPTSETMLFTACEVSGQRASADCPKTYEVSWPQSAANSPECSYHQVIHLNQTEHYQVNSSCYDVNQIVHKSWFVLPPVQAWYYRQNSLKYRSLPPFLIDCEEVGTQPTMEMIYPHRNAKIFIPKELDGSMGQSIFEASHSDTNQVIYWHLDGEYIGQTKRAHQMGIRASQGQHLLLLLDGQGLELKLSFEVLSE